ncbi:MAG: NAD(P)(+) transhydrogenase (Re/Si-specific) subunit beta [Candidatus Omnitrophica bacterium]|nr:NAD(P)(+) transhydrogenase (Re/Si-specific) subunit beta [Candidatus Omnitrophota bacterium]
MNLTIGLLYLVSAVLFILGMKRLSSPETARSGNLISAAGMFIAIVSTIPLLSGVTGKSAFHHHLLNYILIIAGILIGLIIGALGAYLVKMTAIPQMVALFNGVGGGAAALVATMEFLTHAHHPGTISSSFAITMLFASFIGSISFTGSLIAFGKLQGLIERPITYPLQKIVNGIILFGIVLLGIYLAGIAHNPVIFGWFFIISLLFGVLMVLPIGGADMPVIISFLNSFTGIAVAADGFTINNVAMIIGGTLVGSSGTLLTILMCKAMNRSITNVLFGAFGKVATKTSPSASIKDQNVKPITADDVAVMLAYAQLVIIVPGYGLAVAQAQHQVRELEIELEKRGVDVKYAIHPVAGRMPGHMNVLLAEANVPYDRLYEMDQINPEFKRADVVLVIGANDVVNPAARNSPGSPIYGMPILDVEQAKQTIVLKRSMNPGFAGIENELFYKPNTRMLFGDAKDSVSKLVNEVKKIK